MTCGECRFALWEALDLGRASGPALQAHRASCPSCESYAKKAERLDLALTAEARAPEIDLVAAVLARIERPAPAPEGGLWLAGPAIMAAAIAAAGAWGEGRGWRLAIDWMRSIEPAALLPGDGWLEPLQSAAGRAPSATLAWLAAATLYLWWSTHRAAFLAAGRQGDED